MRYDKSKYIHIEGKNMRKWLKLAPQIAVVLALLGSQMAGAVSFWTEYDFLWGDNVGDAYSDEFYDVIAVSDGYVAVGKTGGLTPGELSGFGYALIAKWNLDGSLAWVKSAGGSSWDLYYSVTAVSDGYIAVGYTSSSDSPDWGPVNGSSDALMVKYDFNGNIVWAELYGGSGVDRFVWIEATNTGLVMTGMSTSTDAPDWSQPPASMSYGILVTSDFAGNVSMSQSVDMFTPMSVAASAAGYVVVGYAFNPNMPYFGNNGGRDAIIMTFDLAGNFVWGKNEGGTSGDQYNSVIALADGYVVGGYTEDVNSPYWGYYGGWDDCLIVKYDLSGNIVWADNIGGSGSEVFYGVGLASDGIWAVGYSDSTDAAEWSSLNGGIGNGLVVKYDFAGNFVLAQTIGGSDYDEFFSVVESGDRLIVVGDSYSADAPYWGNNGSYDAVIAVFELWADMPGVPGSGGGIAERFSGVSSSLAAFAIGALVVSALGATWCYTNRSK